MKVPPFSLEKQLADLGTEIDAAVLKVLHSGQYIGGLAVDAFEEAFSESVGVTHTVSCNSGTDALVLALRALDIGIGDEVITSSFSFFATAEAISAVGAVPVFVDVDPKTYLINLNAITEAITSATKAILPVHLFGCPLDMESLMDLARKNNLKVIEDCAQASGAKWKERSVGSWGDIGCFSFFPTKNLGAVGDGGAATTNDQDLAKRMRQLAVHGMPRRYVHTELGYNSRLDAIQAAILNVKLPRLNEWVQKRQNVADYYHELLKDLIGIQTPINSKDSCLTHAWNQYVIRVDKDLDCDILNSINSNKNFENSNIYPRDWIKEKLLNRGVNTIIYYPIPIHMQPAYQKLGYLAGDLPRTEKLCNQVLSLPMFPEISNEQQSYVVQSIKEIINGLASMNLKLTK